jgi:hypothetical protein
MLGNGSVVLVRSDVAANLGATARVMPNMGLTDLLPQRGRAVCNSSFGPTAESPLLQLCHLRGTVPILPEERRD